MNRTLKLALCLAAASLGAAAPATAGYFELGAYIGEDSDSDWMLPVVSRYASELASDSTWFSWDQYYRLTYNSYLTTYNDTYVDAMDNIAWVSHGNHHYFNPSTWTQSLSFGTDLELAYIFSCTVFSRGYCDGDGDGGAESWPEWWNPMFDGLHMIMGYRNVVYFGEKSDQMGEEIAANQLAGLTVMDAYYDALDTISFFAEGETNYTYSTSDCFTLNEWDDDRLFPGLGSLIWIGAKNHSDYYARVSETIYNQGTYTDTDYGETNGYLEMLYSTTTTGWWEGHYYYCDSGSHCTN